VNAHSKISCPSRILIVFGLALMAISAQFTQAAIETECVNEIAGPFPGGFCNANDVSLVLVGLGVQDDGCVTTLDTQDILLRGVLESTTGANRYDIGMWISTEARLRKCETAGTACTMDTDCPGNQSCVATARHTRTAGLGCARDILREPGIESPPVETCMIDTGTSCLADLDCPGAGDSCDFCDPDRGGVDLTCGAGTYLNDDGDGCGDLRKVGTGVLPDCGQTKDPGVDNIGCDVADGNDDAAIIDFDEAITLDCVDTDGDGFAEIPTCVSWSQQVDEIECPFRTCSGGLTQQCRDDGDCPGVEVCNYPNTCSGDATQDCRVDGDCVGVQTCTGPSRCGTDPDCRIALAVPGNSSKCNCQDDFGSNVPVPDPVLSCTCNSPTTVRPGYPVTCTVSYDNQSSCVPLGSTFERYQCGTMGYVAFDLDDTAAGTYSQVCVDSTTGTPLTGICSIAQTTCSTAADCPGSETCDLPTCTVDGDCPAGAECSASFAGGTVATGGSILWTPESTRNLTPAIVGPGDNNDLSFIYTVDSGASGAIAIDVTTQWTNKFCSNDITQTCESDTICGAGTCGLSFTTPTPQAQSALTATCAITADATYATVSSFKAIRERGRVVVEWETSSEVGTLGFHVFRHDAATNSWVQLNEQLLVAAQHVPGGYYRLEDRTAHPGGELVYRLVEVDDRGGSRTHGPFRVRAETPTEPARAIRGGRDFDVEARAATRRRAEPRSQRAQKPAGLSITAGERVKIEVTDSGLYRVEASQIAPALGKSTAEISALIGSNGLRLTYRDETVAWHPSADGQAVVFYGEAIDSPFTRENVYWLAPGTGQQMSVTASQTPRFTRSRLQSFAERLPFEDDLLLRPTLGTDPEGDYWFWKVIITGNPDYDPALLDLEVPGVAAAGSDTALTVNLFGVPTEEIEPSYHALIRINGQEIGTASWGTAGWHEEKIFLAQSLLNDGANTMEVEGLEGNFFVDSVEVEYQRRFEAVEGSLLLRGDDHDVVTVSGFSSRDVAVYDLADPRAPKRLQGVVVRWAADKSLRASFDISDPETPYLAIQSGAWSSPTSLQGVPSSDLRSEQNSADYLVVTSSELATAANRLADYRRARGLEVMVVEVDEIMNEFNGGIANPEAIRSFLAYAYNNWYRAPRMAVLAGKGSYDYRNLLGQGGNFVPPIMAPTSQGLVPADNLYGDVAGNDGVPEIAIGRLPVLTSEELETAVDKIAAYESSRGPWKREILMIADDPDEAGDFPADSDSLSTRFRRGVGLEKIYLSQPYTAEEAREQIVDRINLGALLVTYVGHGGFDRLADEGLLRSEDVDSLVNDERLPVVAALTCNIGLFAFPGFTSLGEELLIHDAGGAAAVWAPTALSINSQAMALGDRVMESLFSRKKQPLGRALARALKDYVSHGGLREVALSYSLLGDPALEWIRPISGPQ